jgi:transglutaminase-like putative cysteine protease
MTKTGWAVTTALVLAVVSVTLAGVRRYVLGPDIDGRRGAAWKVTLAVEGRLTSPDATVAVRLPPDFRGQHILDERFQSKELITRMPRGKAGDRRELVWRRAPMSGKGEQSFRLGYSFRCVLDRPRRHGSHQRALDDAPNPGEALAPSARIQSDAEVIRVRASDLVSESLTAPVDQLRALFDHVSRYDSEPSLEPMSAEQCLRQGSGDSGGKSRLLVALCRNRGIPARLVSGLILGSTREQGLHHWVEAHVNDRWVPMCPTYRYFGTRLFPRHYLVLHLGDDDPVRCSGARIQFGFAVQDLRQMPAVNEEAAAAVSSFLAPLKAFLLQMSLYHLHPAEQHLVKFLLLLPLAALIVSIFRTLIGVPTFGTFSAALLGLAFIDLRGLPWGLGIFVLTVLAGWGMRRLLERFHLLQVPRIAAMLTLIVMLLIGVIVAASQAGVAATHFISLFPLVILTHLVERFWTIEAEDGTVSSFRTLLGTLVVAVTVSVCLAPEAVAVWMFRYPETLGLVLAAQFLLGRYTGYRLSELYRFRDLLQDDPPAVGGMP